MSLNQFMRYHGHMDYPSWYMRISAPFRGESATRIVAILDKALVYLFAVSYVAVLAWLLATGDAHFAKALLVPACTFALTTVLRSALDRPRPYERYRIDPIIHKDTQGKSTPSRHMASAVAIACTFLWLSPPAGAIALAGCAVIAFTRIVGGVHYPHDIAIATALSALCALIGYIFV